jgi:uncharacterized protein (TIGR02265 family)
VQRIKGGALKARLAFVEERMGAEALGRVLGRVAEGERHELGGLLATKWYPLTLQLRLDEAIAAEAGGAREQVFRQLGAASAERNLTGAHRDFLAPGDPLAFLERVPLVYSFYYDQGRRTFEKLSEREGRITTFDAPHVSAEDCLTICGWYTKALEMCGAKAARVVEEECRARGGKVCRYRVSWS